MDLRAEDLLADVSMPRNFTSNSPATVEDIDELMQQIAVICQQQSRVLNLTKAVMSERIRELEDAILVGHVSIPRGAAASILNGSNLLPGNSKHQQQQQQSQSQANNNNNNRFRDPSSSNSNNNNPATPDGSWRGDNNNNNNNTPSGKGQFTVSSDSSANKLDNNNSSRGGGGGGGGAGFSMDDLLATAEEDNRREQQLQQMQSGGKLYMTQSSSAAPSAAHLAARAMAGASSSSQQHQQQRDGANSRSGIESTSTSLSRPQSGMGNDLPSPFANSSSSMGRDMFGAANNIGGGRNSHSHENSSHNNRNSAVDTTQPFGGSSDHMNDDHHHRGGGGHHHDRGGGGHHQQQQQQSRGGDRDRDRGGSRAAAAASLQFFVTVQFKRGRMLTYESGMRVSAGQFVVVGGDRGEDIGSVVACWPIVEPPPPNAVADRATGADNGAGTQVVRVATITEVAQLQGIQNELEMRACEVAQQKVQEHNLRMRIVDAEYQFDRKKLTFYYQAQQRLDFRVLVRDLFKTFRARIWMELDPQNPTGPLTN